MADRLSNVSERGEQDKVVLEFVDEKSSKNPFNDYDVNRGIATTDVFEINDQEKKISAVGVKEAVLFKIKERGEILEVGWGGNGYFAEGIFKESGVPISILDSDWFENSTDRIKPPLNAVSAGKFNLNLGLAQELSENPQLVDKKFGTIMFHGSLFGSGYNWTIQQSISRGVEPSKIYDLVDRGVDMILRGSKDHLIENGQLVIVSDRFSLYSAGRTQKEIPLEKIEFLDIVEKVIRLKAKKITVVGVSSDGVLDRFANILDPITLNQITGGVNGLPDNIKFDYLSRERVFNIKNITKNFVPASIGLIDAISVTF